MTATPESALVAQLRAMDAAIAAGRASPDIARREAVTERGNVVTEICFDTADSALREVLGRLLARHHIRRVRKRRQKSTEMFFIAPSVFASECLGPELAKIHGILDAYFMACVQRALGDLFLDELPTSSAAGESADES